MNLQQLEYIIAVDRFKKFSAAADHCHITQATLSIMVKKLEEELGVTIFNRSNMSVSATHIGSAIIEEAKRTILHSNLIKEKAQKRSAIEGEITIGLIPTIANSLLPLIIKPILKSYPKLHVNVVEFTTNSILKRVKDGTIDLGILSTPLSTEDIEARILYYEALMVYGKIDKEKKYILPDDLKEEKIWLLEEGHCLRNQFVNLCSLRKRKINMDNLNFEAGSFETLLNMVDAFGGLTLIPELYYQTLPKDKKKKISFFESPIPVREVSVVYYPSHTTRLIVEALSVLIIEEVSQKLISRKYKNSELIITKI